MQYKCSLWECLQFDLQVETKTNPWKVKSVVHSLAPNNEIIYDATGFDIIYI
jgi:hypothetical protein